ncbi:MULTISPECIES: alpha/beta fold hydrolase [Actinokineospora]|uniref:Peptidase n=1 Tax=Actinokineospora fastidiosa TaxID=1816 RepID=A0A918GPQ2_9PSEU|nr:MULTISPECIES: alpha/beta hydrolase [Actinokineospora]GGS50341.1 peptidase [Actinokineospora fastidiosa]
MRWNECGPEIGERLGELALPQDLEIACGRVNGVLDSPYAPGRGTMRMQVLRAGSGEIPIAVFNDIDGLPGTLYAAQLAARMPKEFLAAFSLVGVDRRGTGNSDAVRCVPSDVRQDLLGADPRALEVTDWIDLARSAGQNCSIALESRLPALDTWRTAADAEAVRVGLGMEHLHAIGHGEGSRVLSVFAERYPDRVGRMVLDGHPDPDEDARVVVTGVAAGAEATLDAFAEDCAARSCPLEPGAREVVSEVLTGPGAGILLRAVLHGLRDRADWPELATAIAEARDGSYVALGGFVDQVAADTGDLPATFDGTLVVRCNDTKSRLATEQIEQTTRELHDRYPVFGALSAQWLALCGPWPVSSKPVPQATAKTAPPIVLLSTAADPVTPMEGTERALQRMATGVGVAWQGSGHGALAVSPCATEAATAFLRDGTVPRDGTVCPP